MTSSFYAYPMMETIYQRRARLSSTLDVFLLRMANGGKRNTKFASKMNDCLLQGNVEDSSIAIRNFVLRDTQRLMVLGNNNNMWQIRNGVMNGDRQRDIQGFLVMGNIAVIRRNFVNDGRRDRVEKEMMTKVEDEAAKMRRKIVFG